MHKPKKAILLAAGFGTRLRPITDKIPKCLVPIAEKPLLEIWLRNLEQAGFQHVLINTHYKRDVVENFINTLDTNLDIEISFEPELLGTAGTLIKNLDFFDDTAPTLVAHADNLTWIDFHRAIDEHEVLSKENNSLVSLMCFETEQPSSAGILELDANRRVNGFHEKVIDPPGNLANAAIYFFNPKATEYLANLKVEKPDISLDLIPKLSGKLSALSPLEYLLDIGTIENLTKANASVLKHNELSKIINL